MQWYVICYQWFQQGLFRRIVTFLIIAPYRYSYLLTYLLTYLLIDWAPLNPVLANGHSLKRTPSNTVWLRDNLNAYATIMWHKWSGQPGSWTQTRRSL